MIVDRLSAATGVAEDALTLLFAILIGYPISIFYRLYLFNRPKESQLAYFAATGAVVMFMVCGIRIWHSALDATVAWIIVTYFPGKKNGAIFSYVWFLGHLLIGYYRHESSDYDMTWTTPHCILTLRLIGLVMDVYDGHNAEQSPTNKGHDITIKDSPTMLEVLAYAWFPNACLIGPQFPIWRLRQLIDGKFLDAKTGKPHEEAYVVALKRFVPGVVYMIVYSWGHAVYSNDYMTSDEFLSRSYPLRVLDNLFWFRFIMCRYMGGWLLVETGNVLNGLARNESTSDKWDGVRDFHISRFELGYTCQSMVDGFNYNTNQWSGRYIFRRLKFLGNRYASHGITLLFLAAWHGFHLGYFMLFFYEFACVVDEKQMESLVARRVDVQHFFNRSPGFYLKWIYGHVLLRLCTSFGFLTFGMVKKERWIIPLRALYFHGYILVLLVWPAIYTVLRRWMRHRVKAERRVNLQYANARTEVEELKKDF